MKRPVLSEKATSPPPRMPLPKSEISAPETGVPRLSSTQPTTAPGQRLLGRGRGHGAKGDGAGAALPTTAIRRAGLLHGSPGQTALAVPTLAARRRRLSTSCFGRPGGRRRVSMLLRRSEAFPSAVHVMTRIYRRHRAAVGRRPDLPRGPALPHGVHPQDRGRPALQRRPDHDGGALRHARGRALPLPRRRGHGGPAAAGDPDRARRASSRSPRATASSAPTSRPWTCATTCACCSRRACPASSASPQFQEDFVYLTPDAADLPGAGRDQAGGHRLPLGRAVRQPRLRRRTTRCWAPAS